MVGANVPVIIQDHVNNITHEYHVNCSSLNDSCMNTTSGLGQRQPFCSRFG